MKLSEMSLADLISLMNWYEDLINKLMRKTKPVSDSIWDRWKACQDEFERRLHKIDFKS